MPADLAGAPAMVFVVAAVSAVAIAALVIGAFVSDVAVTTVVTVVFVSVVDVATVVTAALVSVADVTTVVTVALVSVVAATALVVGAQFLLSPGRRRSLAVACGGLVGGNRSNTGSGGGSARIHRCGGSRDCVRRIGRCRGCGRWIGGSQQCRPGGGLRRVIVRAGGGLICCNRVGLGLRQPGPQTSWRAVRVDLFFSWRMFLVLVAAFKWFSMLVENVYGLFG